MDDMSPQEIQTWCDNHPEYLEFKKECKKMIDEYCKNNHLNQEEFEKLWQ